jgi:putative ABC transport system permease protein
MRIEPGQEAGEMLADLWRDVRLALRGLRKAPAFTLVAVLTLAVGIGANTAVFSVLRALVLAPLPYPHLDRLVVIRKELVKRGIPYYAASVGELVRYRDAPGFEEVAGVAPGGGVVTDGGEPERVVAASVTPGFFAMMGVTPALGRAFTPEEGVPGASRRADHIVPVILSHGFWTRRFGGDPDILGRQIHFNYGARGLTVVGVLPKGFRFVTSTVSYVGTDRPDVWVPLGIDPATPYGGNNFIYTVGLLKPGVSVEQANQQIAALTEREREEFAPAEAAGLRAYVVPFQEDAGSEVRPMLFAFLGAVGFVLLIACVNVANLLLVRAAGRTREMSIRAALGGGRSRIVRQLLAEAGVLALAGGAAGLALAWAGVPVLARLVPPEVPRVGAFSLDPAVMGFSALVTMLAATVFGLYPAVRASRADLMGVLRGRGTEARHGVRARLVVVEVALSFVLVVGAGLMVRSFVAIRRVDPGFRAPGVLTFSAMLPANLGTAAERTQMKERMRARLEAIPGVLSVGAGSSAPLSGDEGAMPYGNEVTAAEADQSNFRQAWFRTALPGYFKTLETPVLEGRTFTPADERDSTNDIVVDERLAQANWPGQSAVGKRLYIKITDPPEWWTVIGVVHDQHQISLARETQETIWFPARVFSYFGDTWNVRVRGNPAAFGPAVRAALHDVDDHITVDDMRPLTDLVDKAEAPTTLVLEIASVFGGMALLLAVVGLYGVIAYIVRERTGEFGLRMALGSGREGVFRMVLRQGIILASVGVGIGVVGALLLTRLMTRVLVGVAPDDPPTLAAVAAVFAAVTVVACLAPAIRAVRVDPMVALRSD